MHVLTYDACVVGAGPAGSAAALTLARAGCSVLLLDAKTFPRDKVCGDLIGTEAIATLRSLGVSHVVEDGFALDGARVYGPTGRYAGAQAGAASDLAAAARVLPREIFDTRLLAEARSAGTTFASERVLSVEREANREWAIETAVGKHRARTIVGADGYGSRVAAAAGRPLAKAAHLAIVVRAYADGASGLGDAMHFFVNAKNDGYGWIFPLASGRANIGLGFVMQNRVRAPDVRAAFERFTRATGPLQPFLNGAHLAQARAWPIPLGWQRGPVASDGLFLAGDAASLASPLSGSGIHHALESGMMAANAAIRHVGGDDAAHVRYARALTLRFAPRLHVERAVRLVAGTATRVEPFLQLARALPPGDVMLARLLLKLG